MCYKNSLFFGTPLDIELKQTQTFKSNTIFYSIQHLLQGIFSFKV